MEYVAGFFGVLLLMWLFIDGGGRKDDSKYSVKQTGDDRYCEVVENETGKVVFVGTEKQCEGWIEDHK